MQVFHQKGPSLRRVISGVRGLSWLQDFSLGTSQNCLQKCPSGPGRHCPGVRKRFQMGFSERSR